MSVSPQRLVLGNVQAQEAGTLGWKRGLLACGALSSVLYVVAIDVIAALRYSDYHDYADQMVSELMAVGAPTRMLLVWLFVPYNLLVLAFAAGVWAVDGSRTTRQSHRASWIRRSEYCGTTARAYGHAWDRGLAARRSAHCHDDCHVDPHRRSYCVRGVRARKAVPALLIRDDRHGSDVRCAGRRSFGTNAGSDALVGPRRAGEHLRHDALDLRPCGHTLGDSMARLQAKVKVSGTTRALLVGHSLPKLDFVIEF
jgi:hypothetical protein